MGKFDDDPLILAVKELRYLRLSTRRHRDAEAKIDRISDMLVRKLCHSLEPDYEQALTEAKADLDKTDSLYRKNALDI